MNQEEIKVNITNLFEEAKQKGLEFSDALNKLRQYDFEFDPKDEEQLKQASQFAKEIDMRTSFLLRGVLVQHGNVLFL